MSEYDNLWQTLIHKKAKLPYILNVSIKRRPKKPAATVVFLHGIGNNGQSWQKVINALPENLRIISIDLLGHGKSPKPRKINYDLKTQARSVVATLLANVTTPKVIIVGHSMGALVAIEVAKRHPKLIRGLVLCSPPLYAQAGEHKLPRRERGLKRFYDYLDKNPAKLPGLSKKALRFKIMNETFTINQDTLQPFIAALKGSIVEQSSLHDAHELKVPFTILHGRFDPLVLKTYHRRVVKSNPRGDLKLVQAHHDVRGKNYIAAVVRQVKAYLPPSIDK